MILITKHLIRRDKGDILSLLVRSPLLPCYSLDNLGWKLLNQPLSTFFSFHPNLSRFSHRVYNSCAVSCASSPLLRPSRSRPRSYPRKVLGDQEPCAADRSCKCWTVGSVVLLSTLIHVSWAKRLQITSPEYPHICVYICMYVCARACVFIKLCITAQSGPVVLMFMCVCMCVCLLNCT